LYIDLFADGDDFSWETIEKGRNIYYQKQIANQLNDQMTKTISLLTSALNIHLNLGQNLIINSSEIFVLLEAMKFESLPNKQIGNGRICIPLLTPKNNDAILIRVSLVFVVLWILKVFIL
jgi:hypothetical protein